MNPGEPKDYINSLEKAFAELNPKYHEELLELLKQFIESKSSTVGHELAVARAIQKAQQNGWKAPRWIKTSTPGAIVPDADQFIFRHDFAKALWGEEWKSAELLDKIPEKQNTYKVGTVESCWQWHLKNMVVADDPLKYLGQNI